VIVDLVKSGKLKPSALERLGFDQAEIADEPTQEDAAKVAANKEDGD
jgi:hypothetical protein